MIDWGNFSGFFTTGLPSAVLYTSLSVSVMAIVMGLANKCVNNKTRFVLWVLLIEYLFVLICSTVICRDAISFEFDRLELSPLWTYSAVIHHTPGVSVWDIVLNVVLFVPLGLLIKMIYPKISVWRIVFIGLVCSVFIEANQFLFEKGAAQSDDVMHNTLGAVIGWMIAKGIHILKTILKKEQHCQ